MCKVKDHLGSQINILALFLFPVFLFSLPLSCSRSEPQISYGFISLVYYQEKDEIRERFSFFIIPEDEDGLDNLEELLLYNDREQLRWKLTKDDWMSFVQGERTWIGSWSLAIDGDEGFPRGLYRAVLINKGGEKSQKNFSFDAPEESRFPFPSLEIKDSLYTIISSYPDNRLVCYDAQGNFISTAEITLFSGNIRELNLPAEVQLVSLWAEDPGYFTSAFTEAASLR